MNRIFAPSPTVRSQRTPLYNMGWLGDTYDDLTNSIINSDNSVSSPDGSIIQDLNSGNILDISTGMVYGADGSELFNPINPATGQPYASPTNMVNLNTPTTTPGTTPTPVTNPITSFFNSLAKSLSPGPAPRVSTVLPTVSPLQQQTVIKGVPDVALIGGGLLLVVALAGKR